MRTDPEKFRLWFHSTIIEYEKANQSKQWKKTGLDSTVMYDLLVPVTVTELVELPGVGEDDERHIRIAENG